MKTKNPWTLLTAARRDSYWVVRGFRWAANCKRPRLTLGNRLVGPAGSTGQCGAS